MTDKRTPRILKRHCVLLLAVLMIFSLLPAAAFAADYDNHWSRAFIDDAKTRGWMTGYEDGSFKPNNSITRGEFAAMLWRALGEPAPAAGSTFTDVAANAWYHDAVVSLSETGVAAGTGNNAFSPGNTLTREMGFTMLARALKLTAEDTAAYGAFSDGNAVSTWARGAVSALSERGYVSGSGDNQCAPQRALTRGEMAKLLITVFDGEEAGTEPGQPVGAPSITLSHSPTETTIENVTVTVTATDDDGIAYIGWRNSSSGATYSGTTGFSDITGTGKFTVSRNGWYAVCATDKAGNFGYKLIQITNISGTPAGGGSGGGGGGGGGATPTDNAEVTKTAIGGVNIFTVKTDGTTLTDEHTLYIFNGDNWVKVGGAEPLTEPAQTPIEYAAGSRCIIVLTYSPQYDEIADALKLSGGSESTNQTYKPSGTYVYTAAVSEL